MRCFLGVFPPAEVQESIHRALRSTPDLGLRWTPADNLHLTLHFLGDVDEGAREELVAAAERAAAGRSAFGCRLGGLGAFPPRGRPRVLYVDLLEGATELRQLHHALQVALPQRWRPARSSFRPHLTVCRPKGRITAHDRENLSGTLADQRWEFTAGSVDLVQSELQPEGATYRRLHAALLAGGPSTLS